MQRPVVDAGRSGSLGGSMFMEVTVIAALEFQASMNSPGKK
jgi:hypothetical protein